MRTTRLALLLVLAALVAACGGAPAATDGPAGSPSTTAGSGTPAPAMTAEPSTGETATDAPPSSTPAESEDPPPTDEIPTEGPTQEPVEPTATPSASSAPGSAAACSGSDANRSFFQAAADAVDWPVLCAALPKGWFLSEGSYRQANGGKVLVAYKGPGGATLALSEGVFCSSDDGCVPSGGDLGEARLGPLNGTLVGLDSGGFAIVVARGLSPSWLMTTSGLDRAAAEAMGAALVEVDG